jgi:hypothetical protein
MNDPFRHEFPLFKVSLLRVAPFAEETIKQAHLAAPAEFAILAHFQFDDLVAMLKASPEDVAQLYRQAVELLSGETIVERMLTNTRHPVGDDGYIALLYQSEDEKSFHVRARVFVGDLVPEGAQWALGAKKYVYDGIKPEDDFVICGADHPLIEA